ncbi:ABC transporter permease [Methylocapsa sp. S129]|uniref:ABC transporter permease n=1 Tax=Methylocapsa sp. S129 TaxID=1641869 RepID=UPI00131E93C9|nr:ABC transporter permease [Methylocapsa sp. S129]
MRDWFSLDRPAARLILGLALALAIAAGLVMAAGADPLAALVAMADGAFGERYAIAETLIQATPLAIVALGVAPAVRAGVFTIGSEGQLIAGATAATAAIEAIGAAPAAVLLAAGLLAGVAGGALWAVIPAVMRAYFRVNEVLSTLLLNYIAGYGLLLLLKTSLGAHAVVAISRSDALPAAALIPKLIGETRLHAGLVAAPVAALLLGWWLRSPRGLVYDAFAIRPALAARLGVAEPRAVMTTMLVAGAAAGFAGWMQVAGVAGTLYPSVGGGLGFSGILVAMLGGLRPLGILAMALVLGALTTGADGLQTGTGVPSSLSIVIQGLLLLVAALAFNGRARAAPSLPETAGGLPR